MNWLAQNWVWLAIAGAFVWMMRMHGGHGGHAADDGHARHGAADSNHAQGAAAEAGSQGGHGSHRGGCC